jgi:hypothetical protein
MARRFCARGQILGELEPEPFVSRILIAYYSRSGHTQRAAHALADRLGATLLPITERRSRRGAFGYLRSAWEALQQRDAELDMPAVDLAPYDLVVIGTPVWASHPSSPARTFAKLHRRRMPRIALLCTLGGSGADAVFAELQSVLGQAPLATLALTDRELDSASDGAKLDALAATLAAKVMSAVR